MHINFMYISNDLKYYMEQGYYIELLVNEQKEYGNYILMKEIIIL